MDLFTKRLRIVIAAVLLITAVYFSCVILNGNITLKDIPERDIININTASMETLMELDGIGEEIARRIIKYREENGPFEKAEDIMKIDGIGEVFFENNKKSITV